MPVTVTTFKPTDAPEKLPALYVVQPRKHTSNTVAGTVSGDLQVIFYRRDIHREFDVDAVRAAVDADRTMHLIVRDVDRHEQDGVIIEALPVEVRAAFLPVPVIAGGSAMPMYVSAFTSGLAADLVQALWFGGAGGKAVVTASAFDVEVTDDRTDRDGVRRRVLEADLVVQPGAGCPWGGEEIAFHLEQVIAAQQDRCLTTMGRVVSASCDRMEPVSRHGRKVHARFEFASRALGEVQPTPAPAPVEVAVPAQRARRVDPLEQRMEDGHPGSRTTG